jgi:hypothetical protein
LLWRDSLAVRSVYVKDPEAREKVGGVNLTGCGDEALVWCSDFGPSGFRQLGLNLQARPDGIFAGPRRKKDFTVGIGRFQDLQKRRGNAVRGVW